MKIDLTIDPKSMFDFGNFFQINVIFMHTHKKQHAKYHRIYFKLTAKHIIMIFALQTFIIVSIERVCISCSLIKNE